MKKINIVVQSKDTSDALEQLSSLGLVHVENVEPPHSHAVDEVQKDIYMISRAIEILPPAAEDTTEKKIENWGKIINEILDLRDYRSRLAEKSGKLQRHIDIWDDWGDFDISLIRRFQQKGVYVYLAELPVKELNALPPDIFVEVISRSSGLARCALVSGAEREFSFKTAALPDRRLSEVRAEKKEIDGKISEIDGNLKEYAQYRNELKTMLEHLEKEIEFEKARAGMGSQGTLSYLKGYCPFDRVGDLENAAEKNKWAVLSEDPSGADNVPTLIRNPKWIELIRPVFDIIKTVPGYREVDISVVFLLFFSVFFAMLIGDAGYGALILSAVVFLNIKLGNKMKDKTPLLLMYVLSVATIIWGVLTGTIFGQVWIKQTFKPLMPWLTVDSNMKELCFVIGAVQLTIAHIWLAVRKMPSVVFIADLGWVSVIWGAFFLAKTFIVGTQFPAFAAWLFICGISAVLFFTVPFKNFFKDLFPRLITTFLSIIGSFSDVVSYIRLFAVGMASVAIADAFNQMAEGFGWSSVVTGLATVLILLIGHGLNIVLGAMAVLVHGVRLNVLEFSNHLNMEWSGMEYSPFKGERADLLKSKLEIGGKE
ncbi:MAG: hypothetical protein JW728_05870 [Candidatus Aureabacteria bacterium]|nr:hypothetical protein [Candidatus Auribacterota bacterium]